MDNGSTFKKIRIDRSYVNGNWVSPESDSKIKLFDPATEANVGQVVLCDTATVDNAINSAQSVLARGWGQDGLAARIGYLEDLVEVMRKRADELAECVALEIGAPIDFAKEQQVGTAIAHLEATLAAARNLSLDIVPDPNSPQHRERYEPVGVAAMITPWNWPLNQIALKFGPALIAGCPMVLKPSEFTPRSSVLFAECVDETGLPKGVFNMVLGAREVGEHLCKSPGVRLISFTGSTEVGRKISVAAAKDFKHCILEMGGKSPNILFDDCDVELAVTQGLAHCFRNAGQSCNAASLMLVQEGIYDEVVELATKVADAIPLGLPMSPGNHLGPVITNSQFDRVQAIIKRAGKEGARLVAGGIGRPDGFKSGYFVKPTVFSDVTPEMDLSTEEVFGPVLAIMRFSSEEEAVALANAGEHGLAAYIQTADAGKADRVAKKLHTGLIQVNGTSRLAGAPFGGVKSSGIGRESGIWGIRAYLEIKSISGVAKQ